MTQIRSPFHNPLLSNYPDAQIQYSLQGVNTENVLQRLEEVALSLHCWQGDDLTGFEESSGGLGDGLAVTGNYPGKARTMPELRADLDKAFSLVPGKHRLNLHASYADFQDGKVERDSLTIKQFQSWIDWAKERKMGLDFNPTFFSHPRVNGGLTLTHSDAAVRDFWIAHGKACRRIGAEMGRQLASTTVTNVWIPDGSKDLPVDRSGPRKRLEESLNAIFSEKIDERFNLDAVESKLFGIGSESYVSGSHEFYLGYAIKNQKLYSLDAGHFRPTENLSDKISSVLQFVPRILLHVSRGVRWDSDHVVLLDDPTKAIMEEIVRGDYLSRTHIGLDYFDASINRVAAWVLGMRNTLKALLIALLEPISLLRGLESSGDFTSRLVLLEEIKSLPWGAVWNEYCRRQNTPEDTTWLSEIKAYEKQVFPKR